MDSQLFIHSLSPKSEANMNLVLIFSHLRSRVSETYYFLPDLVLLQKRFSYEMGNSFVNHWSICIHTLE